MVAAILRTLWKIARLYATAIFIFVLASPCLLVLGVLRLLHPPLRRLGVPNKYLPLDLIQRGFALGVLLMQGVYVVVEQPNIRYPEPTLLMFSHASNIDPFVLGGYAPISLRFVGKKSIFRIPIFGLAARVFGHIPIDRENREKAIESLNKAQKKAIKYGRNIAISPEGKRSTSGELLEFKQGPFHTARHLSFPISPCILVNNFNLWPPRQIGADMGVCLLKMFPPIAVGNDDSVDDLKLKVRHVMSHELAKYGIKTAAETTATENNKEKKNNNEGNEKKSETKSVEVERTKKIDLTLDAKTKQKLKMPIWFLILHIVAVAFVSYISFRIFGWL